MKDSDLLLEKPDILSDDLFYGEFENMFQGFRRTMALKTAIDLGLFSHTGKAVTPSELSASMGCDDVMVGMLMDCLADTGFLVKEGDAYRNSEKTSIYLDPASPRYQGSGLENTFLRIERWFSASDYVRNGPEIVPPNEIFGERWIRAIGESALGGGIAKIVSYVADNVDMPSEGTFLDLGGGHGLYTVAFCKRFPGLRGVLFDMPQMTEIAQENFDDYGCDASTVPGDFYKDSLQGPYDVLFSSFNHSVSDSSLCETVFSAVKPGGLLIMRRHVNRGQPDPHVLMEWNMVIREGIEKGKQRFRGSWLPTSDEYIEKMEKLGMEILRREDLNDGSEIVVMKRIG